jgi:SAM-dependent methyltransferase
MNRRPSGTQTLERSASYEHTVDAFNTALRASVYPSGYNRTFRQQRERACLIDLIRRIPAGGRVLDLPCGTGRVTRLIAAAGYEVVGADVSPHMLEEARGVLKPEFPDVDLVVMEALATGVPDEHFDAVFCNRLFHHFNERETRVAVLREFARISRGPVIVSFACTFALDVVWHRIKRRMQGRRLTHYQPVPLGAFCDEFREAGLTVVSRRAVMWGLSRMWYVTGMPGTCR